MINAVIFDCFGVLTTDGWLAFRHRHFSKDSELWDQATVFNKRVDAGLISYADFMVGVAELAGVSAAEARHQIENNRANEQLFEYIRDHIKPHYRIGMLSNAAENWLDTLFEPWQAALFDEVVLSCDVKATKPAPIMYETIATKLDMLPEECLFTDDQPWYVDGAAQAGMTAIVFQDTDQFIREFEEKIL